jgi:hypothetical protein
MIHSLLGVAPSTMPSVFVIQAEAPASIALTGLVTLAITIPLVSLGFMVLARPRALALTVAHFVMNAGILIPGREPELVGPLLLVMTIALYLVDTRLLRKETALRSLEGRFSRLMLVAPIAVMLVRTMFFSVNMLYAGSIFFSVGFALFYTARDWPVTEGAQRLGQAGGTAMLVAGWGLAAMWFLPTAWLPDALEVLVLLIPATGILVGVSVKTVTVADGRVYRTIGGIVATAAVVIAHAVGTSPWVSVVSVCCGALLAVLGLYLREKGSFYAGCFSGLAGIIGGAWSAISFDAAMLWAVPAVLGLLVLTAASVLEIKKDGIARLIRRWHTTWEPRDQDATRVETATGRTMS